MFPKKSSKPFVWGRMTTLSKPDGGVRGIVVGDILRRLISRTIAKQIAKKVEETTAPFQYALTTKGGCECVAHILQTLTELNQETTIISIDGVGAYDLISKNAMMEGLLKMEDGDQILPFVRMFYSTPSTYLWEDELGVTQSIPQGEGEEQGDPLMPMVFALGHHHALVQTQARLGNTEKVMAFLDDIVISTPEPDRVTEAHTIVAEELWSHARIQVHFGKTQVWNRGGIEPEGMEDFTRAARRVKPDAVVWKGDPHLPSSQQGLRVLGVPIGHPEFIKEFLVKKSREHATLYDRIPWVNDPQAAYLLLLMSGSTRANFLLRTVRPDLTEEFAIRHDSDEGRCLCTILGTPSAPMDAQVLASLSFSGGGLGLASAHWVHTAAHFASWADSLMMVRKRHHSHCSDNDQKSRDGDQSKFPTRSRLQGCGGGCRARCALLE